MAWPFGSVLLVLTRGIVLVAATAAIAGVVGAWRAGSFVAPAGVLWWLLAWLLGALQLVPLPAGVHHALAPGSAAVWHPAEPAAAAVLGYGMQPVSLYPDATLRWLAFSAALVGLALAARLALHTRERLLLVAGTITGSGLLLALYALAARLSSAIASTAGSRCPPSPLRPLRQQEPLRGLRRDGRLPRRRAGSRADGRSPSRLAPLAGSRAVARGR